MREPEIALVLSAEPWVDSLHRYCADHGGARVASMVLDPFVALDEEFDVLVSSPRWPALTRSFVEELQQRDRQVLLVGDPAANRGLVDHLGADGVVEASCPPGEIVAAVVALTAGPTRGTRGLGPRREAIAAPAPASADPSRLSEDCSTRSPYLVVGGPVGAGSTEVAIGLAACSARRGARPVLVDADQVSPSVAVRLGLPLEPNLCTAVDAITFGLGAVPGTLFDLGTGWPVVLAGAPNRPSAAALSGSDVRAVGDVLATRFSPVVFDVSAGPGRDGDPGVRAVLATAAQAIVAVGTGDPVGVVRLAQWIDELAGAGNAPIRVVVNRAPATRARREQLADSLPSDSGVVGVTFVPSDARVDDAAWSASFVERGSFAQALDNLYDELGVAGVEPRPPRRRHVRVA